MHTRQADPTRDERLLAAVAEVRDIVQPLEPEARRAVLEAALDLYGRVPFRRGAITGDPA